MKVFQNLFFASSSRPSRLRGRICCSVVLLGSVLLGTVGCARKPVAVPTAQPLTGPALRDEGLLPPEVLPVVNVRAPLPAGWKPDPAKHTSEHDHQTWISPSGRTAYGVIAFHNWLLPIASNGMILDQFLKTMKKTEGEATLVSGPEKDESIDGIRFVAEGGLYRIRALLVTRGSRGWVVYAGTLRQQPLMPEELEVAERSRDRTELGPVKEDDKK